MESPRLIAALARIVRDVGIAEDLAQDALVIALEKWPATGIPDNPGAWLMTSAKRRAIDLLRRNKRYQEKLEEVGRSSLPYTEQDVDRLLDGEIGDDLLRLIFTTCHPVLSQEARVALTLRLLGGLTTDEIAHAFLVPEPTIAQRIVRAKRTLSQKQIPFETPVGEAFKERLPTVLEVIYLMFNEGYTATAGQHLIRPLLCQEALRLGRILAAMSPAEAEVHGLVALMELQSSRMRARVNRNGELVRLMDQNRADWDPLLIRRGLAALERARAQGRPLGPYALQAAISACHAEARSEAETDWVRIAALYEALSRVLPSPVVELNRAVAIGKAFGPEFGLQLADMLVEVPALQHYHLLPSVQGDFLFQLGRYEEAQAAFERAAAMTGNERERDLLRKRAGECNQS
ncbi:RNA polymerase sigma factor [Paenibacillus aurantiacus]|uniref:RNA polymerase sigma factor n=1 Tax=Paenibacillus aurantiacus TaxID=1936118 RepID=A0ABV5KUD9_9BACL